jgi:hypothetical protein
MVGDPQAPASQSRRFFFEGSLDPTSWATPAILPTSRSVFEPQDFAGLVRVRNLEPKPFDDLTGRLHLGRI